MDSKDIARRTLARMNTGIDPAFMEFCEDHNIRFDPQHILIIDEVTFDQLLAFPNRPPMPPLVLILETGMDLDDI